MATAVVNKPKKPAETNIKETIESILVAFILAFIFRCFVVEAFMIPTGSMAPTLMGAHMPLRCTYCGYSYDVGYDTFGGTAPPPVASVKGKPRVMAYFCPNCGYRAPFEDKSDSANDATAATVSNGDRILVMKYLYLLHEPARWDVVVFKSPVGDEPGDYSVNYIKRLMARPGESIFFAHGDLYVAPAGSNPLDLASYHIATKPEHVQQALWRIVYDCDYLPSRPPLAPPPGLAPEVLWRQPWQQSAGTGWVNGSGDVSQKEFLFDNPNGPGTLSFDRNVNENKGALTDFLAYDVTRVQSVDRQVTYDETSYAINGATKDVSDLKLSFTVAELEGDGALKLLLKKGETTFTCELTRTTAKLFRNAADRPLITKKVSFGRASRVNFQNLDYCVSLKIDGHEVFRTTPEQYQPNLGLIAHDQLLTPPAGGASITGDHIKVRLKHLQLWRDTYYRDFEGLRSFVLRATLDAFPKNVVTLGPDEFFVAGDNSYMSLDGRLWPGSTAINLPEENLNVPAGRVPRQFLLGKAFFVYWPAGYQPAPGLPALVPNFGDMRFIR